MGMSLTLYNELFSHRAFSTEIFLSKNGKKETECCSLTDDEIAILKAHIKYDEDMFHSVLYCPYQEYESII